MRISDPDKFLRNLFSRAVEVADPMAVVPRNLPKRPAGRVIVVGAGKASARMAEAVESVWGPCEGLVITRYGYGRPCAGVEIVEAAHPVPDRAGLVATSRMLDLLRTLGPEDFVLALISGGASSLLVSPAGDISLEKKQAINAALLASGAPIDRMNIVRKHLSRVKGGQLAAAACPAPMLSLMISDVPGDDPAFIGSGPTVGDASSPAEAFSILERWNIDVPGAVRDVLDGATGDVPPDHPSLKTCENRVIAAPSQSLSAAAQLAEAAGCEVHLLGDDVEGEAREIAKQQAEIARSCQKDWPVLLLSGGELTVTRRGDGTGGPNAEFALALALALNGAAGIHAIACDTDGVDGAAEVAGAVVSPKTLTRARAMGVDPALALAENDAHSFFRELGNQVVPGPTLTNVNDFRAILVQPAG